MGVRPQQGPECHLLLSILQNYYHARVSANFSAQHFLKTKCFFSIYCPKKVPQHDYRNGRFLTIPSR